MEQEDRPNQPAPLTIFGWDIYAIVFFAIGGAAVLGAIFWIFFTNWPLHNTCGGYGRYSSHDCGWIDRNGRPTPAPTLDAAPPRRLNAAPPRP